MPEIKRPFENADSTDWPDLELSIEELDAPVFQPQQIVPDVSPLDEPTAKGDRTNIQPLRQND